MVIADQYHPILALPCDPACNFDPVGGVIGVQI